MIENISFGGWKNCVRLYNREIELIVSVEIGPRLLSVGFQGSHNFFYLLPEHLGTTGGADWRIYGGHRLWLAPEAMPRTYACDNNRINVSFDGNTLVLTGNKEELTGVVKIMEISLAHDRNEVTVTHGIVNHNPCDIQLAAWALSVLKPGGTMIVPQEPYGEGDDFLLPARPLVLWQYTRMNDPRWTWGNKYILGRHDPTLVSEQKIGLLNKQGWLAYHLNGEILIKRFDYDANAVYTDYGCNNELYINHRFVEVETLSPFVTLPPGVMLRHTEKWLLDKVEMNGTEESIDNGVLPIVAAFR